MFRAELMIPRFIIVLVILLSSVGSADATEKTIPLPQYLSYSLERLVSTTERFPSKISKPIRHQLQLISKKLTAQSAIDLLSLIADLMSLAIEVRIQSGTLNNQSVEYISIGYLVFYAISKQSDQGYIWNPKTVTWDALSLREFQHVRMLWRIQKEYQSNSWVQLPVIPFVIPSENQLKKMIQLPEKSTPDFIFSKKEQAELEANLKKCIHVLQTSPLYFLSPTVKDWSDVSYCHLISQLIYVFQRMITVHSMKIFDSLSFNWPVSEDDSNLLFVGPFLSFSESHFYIRYLPDLLHPVRIAHDSVDLNLLVTAQSFHKNALHEWIPFIGKPYDRFIVKESETSFFQGDRLWLVLILSLLGFFVFSVICFHLMRLCWLIFKCRLYQIKNQSSDPHHLVSMLLIFFKKQMMASDQDILDRVHQEKTKWMRTASRLKWMALWVLGLSILWIVGYAGIFSLSFNEPIIFNVLLCSLIVVFFSILSLMSLGLYRLLGHYYIWKLENIAWLFLVD